MAEDMKDYRKRIDEIDSQLLKLYEERMDVVTKIGKYKMENGLPVFDAAREDAKLDEVFASVKNKKYADGAAQLFITLMQASKELQEEILGISDNGFDDIDDLDDFNWDGEPVELNLDVLGKFENR